MSSFRDLYARMIENNLSFSMTYKIWAKPMSKFRRTELHRYYHGLECEVQRVLLNSHAIAQKAPKCRQKEPE